MSKSKRKANKTPRLTPYRKTSEKVDYSIFKDISKNQKSIRYSAYRRGPVTREFFTGTIQNARLFSREHDHFIQDYSVLVYGVDKNGHEYVASPQGKRDIFFHQDDDEKWDEIEEYLDDIKKRYDGWTPRFMMITLMSDKTQKEKMTFMRAYRARKQAEGRAEAKHERELQAKEKRESDIRKKRAALKVLREKGVIAPARKKKKKFI